MTIPMNRLSLYYFDNNCELYRACHILANNEVDSGFRGYLES